MIGHDGRGKTGGKWLNADDVQYVCVRIIAVLITSIIVLKGVVVGTRWLLPLLV